MIPIRSDESSFQPPRGVPLLSHDYGNFSIAERAYEPDLLIEKHSHKEAHLVFPLAGSYTETLAGREELCRTGMVLYRPEHILHTNRFHNRGARTLLVQLQSKLVGELKLEAGLDPQPCTLTDPRALVLAGRLREEFWDKPSKANQLVMECLVMELMVEAHRQRPLPSFGRSAAAIRAAELLRDELATSNGLGEIARRVNLHPVQLCREFKKHFACTMGEYLQKCRVEQAKTLLSTTTKSLGEIGQMCGFYDQSHFTRSFRAVTGMNPLQYRKNTRG
jgi:AraC family transcriptional regulator